MNEILAQLIAAAIDADKIPGLDCFDMTRLRITVEDAPESPENDKTHPSPH